MIISRWDKKEKEVCVTPGQVGLFSQIFKPITTALRQVKIKGKQFRHGKRGSISELSVGGEGECTFLKKMRMQTT